MPVDGTINRYVDEPLHLAGMRENEPLHIPTPDEYFAATNRVLIAEDYHQYADDTPFNLEDGPPPAVLGSFTWSGLWVDNAMNVDISAYFNVKQIMNGLPYRAWRVRGLWRGGYFLAYYATSPNPGFTPVINALVHGGTGFNAVDGGWALGHSLQYGNLINEFPQGSKLYYFMGGPPGAPVDLWFPIKFQVEVGYGHPLDGTATRLTAGRDWPAFSLGVGTDLLQYRGYNPNWACFNGYANIPGLVGCPFTGQGGYVPPDPPEDLFP